MVPFTYSMDGEIYALGEPFQQLRQPSEPIPSPSRRSPTSTTQWSKVRAIDAAEVAAFAAPAALAIAHNAAFDRKFLERYNEVSNTKPWACLMSEINWAAEGYEGTKLA